MFIVGWLVFTVVVVVLFVMSLHGEGCWLGVGAEEHISISAYTNKEVTRVVTFRYTMHCTPGENVTFRYTVPPRNETLH